MTFAADTAATSQPFGTRGIHHPGFVYIGAGAASVFIVSTKDAAASVQRCVGDELHPYNSQSSEFRRPTASEAQGLAMRLLLLLLLLCRFVGPGLGPSREFLKS